MSPVRTHYSLPGRASPPSRLLCQVPAPKKEKKQKEKGKYTDTILLPETTFSQRANAAVREVELQEWWEEKGIYKALKENDGEKWVLHDGPPYANGDLHIGHALNKILKDLINRYQMMQGRKVTFVPGWDCHGLPIELKVLQSMKAKERQGLTPVALRQRAAEFATETVDSQRESFKRYGVWADWDSPYMTLDKKYEAAQIGVFGQMLLKGHIYRGRKPVHWSPSSRTALAEAELEYPDNHISKSIYVGFQVVDLPEALEALEAASLKVAIWTTTPWTIPANLAVAVNADLDYSVVGSSTLGSSLIVATDLIATLTSKLNLTDPLHILHTFKGADLQGIKYKHPLNGRVSEVVLGGDYITTESGTGLVHTAPGHGQEDYETGRKYGLPLLSPVDDAGRFTAEVEDEELVGLSVLAEGNQMCVDKLMNSGALLKEEDYNHKYPYDWRTKKPTIFRATDQWFASVKGFREDALAALEGVQFLPETGRNRIRNMVSGRADWCISRQRNWGVPIPVFYHKETGEALLTEHTIAHVQSLISQHGSDIWYSAPIETLLPPDMVDQADQWVTGKDTMDVWFDSGTSWAAVTDANTELGYPADMYLEGSDQHRGWFQSSLLTSVAANEMAPYKTILTHGFVLDAKGMKMSKSLGNVVDPKQVIEGGNNKKVNPAYGADVLRMWVASVDYSSDVSIGDGIIKQVGDGYKKIRNTLRFLIGNLNDFDPSNDQVPYEELPALDKYILGRFTELTRNVTEAYGNYQFNKVSQSVTRFLVADLSNFYLDIAKDRCYTAAPDSARRRSCQTVMQILLEDMARMLAPILPHTAEDVWLNLPYPTPEDKLSIFQSGWAQADYPAPSPKMWEAVRDLRDDVNKVLEAARAEKYIGASLEATAVIHGTPEQIKVLAPLLDSSNGVDSLHHLFITSSVKLAASQEEVTGCPFQQTEETASGLSVGVVKAAGTKCERCWHYEGQMGTHKEHPTLCGRCIEAVEKMPERMPVNNQSVPVAL